jgi:hypothetical protein
MRGQTHCQSSCRHFGPSVAPEGWLPGSLVVQAKTLGLGGEFLGDSPPVGVVNALIGEEGGEEDTATVSDASEGKLAFLKELHQVRPRDVQNGGSLLGRELSVDGCNGHGVAIGDLGEDLDQQSQSLARDLHGGAGVVGIEREDNAGKVGVLAKEPFEDVETVVIFSVMRAALLPTRRGPVSRTSVSPTGSVARS